MRAAALPALLSLAALLGAGCARTAGLDVRYPEAAANRAMLARISSAVLVQTNGFGFS